MLKRYNNNASVFVIFLIAMFNVSCATSSNKVLNSSAGAPMVSDTDTIANEFAIERQRLADEKIQQLRRQAMTK